MLSTPGSVTTPMLARKRAILKGRGVALSGVPPMTLTDLLAALGAHNYLAVFVLVALYLRKVTGPDSKLPIEIAPAWRSMISAAAALCYGVLASRQAGTDWANAVLGGVLAAGSTGFLDGLLTAIFSHGNAPGWD